MGISCLVYREMETGREKVYYLVLIVAIKSLNYCFEREEKR